jgi:predicted transcriptional regulator
LTEAQVEEIKIKYATGQYRQKDLGEEYGVAQPTIGRIVRGKGWR